jgi:methanogenic corrinoid protein MtbC1
MVNEQASLLEQITQAFADGDEDRGHELVAEAIERHEMPSEVVARALSAGLEAWRPVAGVAR